MDWEYTSGVNGALVAGIAPTERGTRTPTRVYVHKTVLCIIHVLNSRRPGRRRAYHENHLVFLPVRTHADKSAFVVHVHPPLAGEGERAARTLGELGEIDVVGAVGDVGRAVEGRGTQRELV